jgi:hypothetical protein
MLMNSLVRMPEPILSQMETEVWMKAAKRMGVLAGLFLLIASAVVAAEWKTYKGPWFSVKYPPGFKVVTAKTQPDSARFRAPDGSVEFYVYSPMWNGEPGDIGLDPARETIKDDNSETRGDKQVHWWTIIAKDGSYCRSYVDTVDTVSNTRLIFGIKYTNEPALKKYQPDYAQFKKSLVQYAD